MRIYQAILLLLLSCWCAGCDMPRDPEQTFDRVQGGVLRVGVGLSPPWTVVDGDEPSGLEPDLIRQFADQLGAQIEWTVDGEERLFESLCDHRLDLVLCGLTDSSPWAPEVGLTQPYVTVDGKRHVMAVPAGENRWLLELDGFLQAQKAVVSPRAMSELSP